MRIECPGCKLSGNIDDATVPATGLVATCPRCKKQFTVERPVLETGSAAAMLDTCPSCQYATFSDEKFSICPKCGLVVADYQRQLLAARQQKNGSPAAPPLSGQTHVQSAPPLPGLSPQQKQKDEEARRRHGLDKIPDAVDSEGRPIVRSSAETPLSILIAGWGVIIAAVLITGFGVSGIMEYLAKVKEAKAAIEALEEAQTGSALLLEFLLFPALSILYSIVMLVLGTQFLAMKRWSIAAIQYGAWAGVGLLGLMKVADMVFWFRRASAEASFGYYAMGVLGDVMLMLLYIAPFLVLAEYLKSSLFEKSEEMFF